MTATTNSRPAQTINSYLKSKGYQIPHTVILEALARAGGYQNRHVARMADKAIEHTTMLATPDNALLKIKDALNTHLPQVGISGRLAKSTATEIAATLERLAYEQHYADDHELDDPVAA
jgi:hypothetical protein